jgi:hypothetical protein
MNNPFDSFTPDLLGWTQTSAACPHHKGEITMSDSFVELSEDEFCAQYPLRPNHLNPDACWSYGGDGCLFETYGEERDFVRQQDPATVWTLVDDGNDGECILSGYHWVNRLGYMVSTVPVPEDTDIEVRID